MALNQAQLKSEIETILTDMQTREQDSTSELADRLAAAIVNQIAQVTVQYVAGLVAPSGPVTGNAQFSIS